MLPGNDGCRLACIDSITGEHLMQIYTACSRVGKWQAQVLHG
jgi:hypothetical protein